MPTPTSTPLPPQTPCAATLSFELLVDSSERLSAVLALLAPQFRKQLEENGVTVNYVRQSTDDVVDASNFEVWDIPHPENT